MTSIGLDLVYLAPGATGGMETYARALVPELARRRPCMRWVAFCGRELASELRRQPWVANLEVVELPVSSRWRVRRVLVEQALLPLLIRRSGVHLVHSLGNTSPLTPGGPPLVLTVHDVIWARLPETHLGILARGLAFLVPRAARRAAAIIADSRATATDIEHFLGVPPERVHVVWLGPGADHPAITPEDELRERLALGDRPLVLCPSPRRAHKNVRRLVDATTGLGATLVVPGYASTAKSTPEATGHVRYLGWVSDADMEGLYRAATLLAFPSLAEGFGLPVLEAMRRGLPVACANTTSLPEISGDAALLFDPLDEEAIRAAVAHLLNDTALRDELARRGRVQAARFSWDAAATNTWHVYDGVIGARARARRPGLLRRIAGHRRVLPATALALRARTVRRSPVFALRELLGRGRVGTYELREAPVRVIVRHGRGDVATLGEVFHEHHYLPPPELGALLDPRVVLDLGANIGLFGAFASARWPRARIVAYEPDPANAAICSRCIEENALGSRWELRRLAAADAAGELRFHASGDALSHADEQGDLVVEARDVLPDLARADLVKMDIEGGEWALLTDPRFAARPPRALVLEYHPYLCPSDDPRMLAEQLLRDAGLQRQAPIFHRGDGHGMLWAWQA